MKKVKVILPGIFYLCLLVVILVLDSQRYSFITKEITYVMMLVYYVISAFIFYRLSKNESIGFNMSFLILLPLLFFIITIAVNPFLALPLIGTIPVLFFKRYQVAFRIFFSILLVINMLVNMILIPLTIFGKETSEQVSVSSNGKYRVIENKVDNGLLGEDIYLSLEEVHFGVLTKHIKTIQHNEWEHSTKIIWNGNESITYKNKKVKIKK